MLKIAKRPEWTHEVTISVPVDGGFENQTCRVRYRLLGEAAIDPTDQTPESMLRAVVVRIDDLVDEATNEPMAWSDAVRDQLFAMPFMQVGLVRGYYRSVTGAREGNSDGSGMPGRKVN